LEKYRLVVTYVLFATSLYAVLVELAEFGERLFNNPTRLLTATWVSTRTDKFFQSEAADGIRQLAAGTKNVTVQEVTKALNRLIDLGMVVALPQEASDRRQYYERLDSPGWDVIDACARAAPRM
jgi:hypothetical protein